MIPVETQQSKQRSNNTYKSAPADRTKKTEKGKNQEGKRREEFRKNVYTKSESEDSSTEENNNAYIYITIWDLPKEINQLEVQHACKRLGEVEEIQIKRSFSKVLAVLNLQKKPNIEIPWAIPIGDEKLARVTKGIEDYKQKDSQSNVIAKLRGIPRVHLRYCFLII